MSGLLRTAAAAVAGVGGFLWLGHHGLFGTQVETVADGILGPLATPAPSTSTPNKNGVTATSYQHFCTAPYGESSRMVLANPNFLSQMAEWQAERKALNQDAYDWTEFRAHEQRLGAPDPGLAVPPEFCAG